MSHAFAFLKLGLPERALADADEAIRRRPDWAKAHFRRAEALSQAYIEGGFGLEEAAPCCFVPTHAHATYPRCVS